MNTYRGYEYTNKNGVAEISKDNIVIGQLFGASDEQVMDWIDKHRKASK